jgi:hypothetical protein
MKILPRHLHAKDEKNFKSTIENESLCEITDENEIRVVKIATSKIHFSRVQCHAYKRN